MRAVQVKVQRSQVEMPLRTVGRPASALSSKSYLMSQAPTTTAVCLLGNDANAHRHHGPIGVPLYRCAEGVGGELSECIVYLRSSNFPNKKFDNGPHGGWVLLV